MSESACHYVPIKSKVPPQDGRSADARLLRRIRTSLEDRIAGKPTAMQAALIDQVCWLTLYLTRLNEKALANGGLHESADAHMFIDYSNSRTAALSQLHLDTIAAPADWSQVHAEEVAA